MLLTESTADILRACQILFSPDQSCSISFLKNLEPSMLKIAYRKRALETHPDRAKALGVEALDQTDRFREVQMAYEVLLHVAEKGFELIKPVWNSQDSERNPGNEKKRTCREYAPFNQFYQGTIPGCSLKIGHFLYYSGIISWNQLISAVAFQRKTRIRYGEIAVAWNMVNTGDVESGLRNKGRDELIGEYLRREGYLNGFQHLAILGKQRKNHVLFGEYFVNEGILTPRQLDIALIRSGRHNQAWAPLFPRKNGVFSSSQNNHRTFY